MAEHSAQLVPRFRRRLTGAFVLVAAATAGVLALATYTLSAGYRNRTFEDRSRDEAGVALAFAPEDLTASSFARLQAVYESRTGASTIARSARSYFTSSPGLEESDIPPVLRDPSGPDLSEATARVDGVDRYVLAAHRRGDDYWFFFSRSPVQDSLRDLRGILAISWLITVSGAAMVGRVVARRTLQPVREASVAAQALASGLLETRLDGASDDEFGQWSTSFNEMAAALEGTIGRLQAAAARERQFTADIAHELRTPLTSMAAAASLLEDDLRSLPPGSQRAGQLLVDDVQRLKDLVLELLELARMDAGSEPVRNERLAVGAALRAVVAPLVGASGDDTVDIRLEAPPELMVEADRARLRRVIDNLIDNAVRHGAPPVEVSARADGPSVLIEVRDHGAGLRADDPAVLFDRFTKSDRSRAGGGSGLGLAIAAGHAVAMGGSLTATNHSGGGAVFSLRLPRGDPAG